MTFANKSIPDLLCQENMYCVVSWGLLGLTIRSISGATKTEFRPSFIAVVEMAIDKGLSLTLGLDDIL